MNQEFTKDFINRDTLSPAPTLQLLFTPYLSPLLFPSKDILCNWCEPEYQNFSLQHQSQLKQQQFDFKLQTMQNMDMELGLLNESRVDILVEDSIQEKEVTNLQVVDQADQTQMSIDKQSIQKIIKYYTEENDLTLYKTEKFIKQLNLSQKIELFIKRINIVLIDKFSSLKKTKEEMIKFCMRKAFKHILDHQKKYSVVKNQEYINFGGKFTQNSYLNSKIKYVKKISAQKSMNSQFLKSVFSEQGFTDDFRQFLKFFPEIIAQDNEKKIKYLADFIMENLCDIQKIKTIRRLPWTVFILQKVSQIGQQLCKYSKS